MRGRLIPISLAAAGFLLLAAAFNNCGARKAGDTAAAVTHGCEDGTGRAAKALSYGAFDPQTMDMCHAYTGADSRWTMGEAAHLALPPQHFGGGTACGACFELRGTGGGAVLGRVTGLCPGCREDEVDMDATHFAALNGGSFAGAVEIEIRPVPCPVPGNLSFVMNGATNPYYLNLSPADFRRPVDTVQVNYGAGFVTMARAADSNDFFLSLGSPAPATVQIKTTDIYGQVLRGPVATASGAVSQFTGQFGDCR